MFGDTINLYSEGGGYYTDWRWLNKLSYSITLHDIHKITAFVAYEARQYAYRNYSGSTGDLSYPFPSTQYLSDGNPNVYPSTVYGGGDVAANVSMFGNVTYSLMDKYLLTGSVRRDGSSKFGEDDIYGNFGAISAGWRISKEKFLENVRWLDDL